MASKEKLPNILFLVLDSARRDMFGVYGCKEKLTPHIDELAKNSMVMNDHYAAGSGSAQAHVSMFLGQHSWRHGVVHNFSEMGKDVVAFPVLLRELGYKTYGHCMASFIPPAGFEDLFGFDDFIYPGKKVHSEVDSGQMTLRGHIINTLKSHPGVWTFLKKAYKSLFGQGALIKKAAKNFDGRISIDYLKGKMKEGNRNGPIFAYSTLLHPHTPYYAPDWCLREVFKGQKIDKLAFDIQANLHAWVNGDMGAAESGIDSLVKLYKAELLYADHLVGTMVDFLRSTGQLENTIIIVTADHGEFLGEHGNLNHGSTIWEELYRLPCLVHFPERVQGGLLKRELSSALDIFPTIFDLLGKSQILQERTVLDGMSMLSGPANGAGRSLVIDCPPIVLPGRLKAYPKLMAQSRIFYRGLRNSEYKYLWQSTNKRFLFKVGEYEDEANNIINENMEIAEKMHSQMVDWYRGVKSDFNIDQYPINLGVTAAKQMTNPKIHQELKKLGYI